MNLDAAFSSDQLAWRSRANGTALILGTIALLKQRGMDVEQWFRDYRLLFNASWKTMEGQGARALMTIFVLNPLSVGATLHALEGNEVSAEGSITGWPPLDMLQDLGLTLDDMSPFWNALGIAAEHHKFEYTWWREEDTVHMRLVWRLLE